MDNIHEIRNNAPRFKVPFVVFKYIKGDFICNTEMKFKMFTPTSILAKGDLEIGIIRDAVKDIRNM